MTASAALEYVRAAWGYSDRELAELLGVHRVSVTNTRMRKPGYGGMHLEGKLTALIHRLTGEEVPRNHLAHDRQVPQLDRQQYPQRQEQLSTPYQRPQVKEQLHSPRPQFFPSQEQLHTPAPISRQPQRQEQLRTPAQAPQPQPAPVLISRQAPQVDRQPQLPQPKAGGLFVPGVVFCSACHTHIKGKAYPIPGQPLKNASYWCETCAP